MLPFKTSRVWTAGKLVLLTGGLAGTFLLFAAIGMGVAVRARQVTVPNLIGKPIEEASREAATLDLLVRIEESKRPDLKVPAGHVLGQDPAPGSAVRRQRGLRLWLSSGPHIALAPALVGEQQRSAEIRLSQDGFAIGRIAEIRSSSYGADVVVAQDPPPATQTTEVRLLVNRGEDRATYLMPDLIGLNGERAADILRTRGFRVSITAQSSGSAVPPGVVVRQIPSGGYQVHPGDPIALEVSQ
jgi:serine/threonine-protein kinase